MMICARLGRMILL
uniref:Uncharacterized protein n=1 Tax=Rhizophora mucronata TaxID=61149 RepID=A0A2P2PVC5_RHIMU